MKEVILIGAGGRGKQYTDIMKTSWDNDFKVVAVAEPVDDRREYIKKLHGIPDEMCFTTWEPLLELEKFADVAIIATMDRDHFAPAMAAIEKGYDLLLEKPVAPTPEECRAIQRAAERKGVFVLVCHVLRYTDFFINLKNIIDSGRIGKVVNIQHVEAVGNIHQSHSFVRGNWGNTEESSMMLLQKSCHDMDILAWLIGKRCVKAQSFGSLCYFKPENAPEGSPERCLDGCPAAESCPYNAKKLYLEATNDDSRGLWFRRSATKKIEPDDEDVIEALGNTQYGKCVYKCSNDVVDHQVVNLLFEDDVCVSFTMSAFNEGGRALRIMGTLGEIDAKMDGNSIKIYDFATRAWSDYRGDEKIALRDEGITGGHGGGDDGIIYALKNLLNGIVSKSVCGIVESCDNHMIAFAAEESRLTGKVIDIGEFCNRYEIQSKKEEEI